MESDYMEQNNNVYDIIIIGGGPAGLFTGFYAGLRQASVKILESLPQLGGQLAALYPEKYIYDIPGFRKITAQDLTGSLVEQMNQFEVDVALGQEVTNVVKRDNVFELTTEKEVHYARTVIITAGNGAFQPRMMNLEEEKQFENKNLHYYVNDMERFRNKEIVIFGGGDSAVDWALMLESIAKKVSIIHRRDRFRAHEHSVEQLKNSKVDILTPYVPIELIGVENIEAVKIQDVKTKEVKEISVDDVLVNYGFISSLGPIKDWGLEIDRNSIVVNSKMETNIEGIYAVGDINTYDGKVKLIATGFGEAPIAVSNAKVYIDPSVRVQPLHSTSVMGDKDKKSKEVKQPL